MFAASLEAVIHSSLSRDVDHLARNLWQAYSAGSVTEEEAARLAMLLEARRGVARAQGARLSGFKPIVFVPRRPQRSPDQQASLLRRRQLSQGPLPPHLCSMFTVGELSVLAIVGAEIAQNGCCDRSVDELAARSGTSRATVQRAVHAACFAGILTKEERPRKGCKSLTNILRCVSREWMAWLKRYRVSAVKPHGQVGFREAVSQPKNAATATTLHVVAPGQAGGSP